MKGCGKGTIRDQPYIGCSQACGNSAGGTNNASKNHRSLRIVNTHSLGYKGRGDGNQDGLDNANSDTDGNHFRAGAHCAAGNGTHNKGTGATANGGKTFGVGLTHQKSDSTADKKSKHGSKYKAK